MSLLAWLERPLRLPQCVTAVGMFGNDALWFVPLGGATVLLTVGSTVERVKVVDGKPEAREHMCLTDSFDHAIVEGAPAARFVRRLSEAIRSGAALEEHSPLR